MIAPKAGVYRLGPTQPDTVQSTAWSEPARATILETRDTLGAGLRDIRYIEQWNAGTQFRDKPIPLSDDEGICSSQEGLVPTILKAESFKFFEYETKMADADAEDMGRGCVSEEWRPIVGWEGLYEVSSLGDVRSLDRVTVDARGRRQTFRGRHLKKALKKQTGYEQVSLCLSEVQEQHLVHTLVARAFIGNPAPGQEVLHIDADRSNNVVTNLRWGTRSENQQQKVVDGNHPKVQRTHCPRGHALEQPNLAMSALKNGHRTCKACARTHARSRYYGGYDESQFQTVSDQYYRSIMEEEA